MSAFIVSPHHISAIVSYMAAPLDSYRTTYYYNGKSTDVSGNEDTIGQILTDANFASVNSRYDTGEVPPVYKWSPFVPVRTPVEILKAVACLDYQSCEYEGWEKSEAYAILETCKSKAIYNLPGYEEASWKII